MAKKSIITSSSIEKAIDGAVEKTMIMTVGDGENAVEVPVKTRLSLSERADMVEDIVSMVFRSDKFAPYFKRFAMDYNLITYFTDIKLPNNAERIYQFICDTGISQRIAEIVGLDYIGDIMREANELIEYRKATMVRRSKIDDVLSAITDVIKSLKEKTDGMDINQLVEMIQKNVPGFNEKIEQALGINLEELAGKPVE